MIAGAASWHRRQYQIVGCDQGIRQTGFRALALASLTPELFDLDADSPIVTLAARHAKNRKTKVQPIPADIAELLRAYVKDRPAGVAAWG